MNPSSKINPYVSEWNSLNKWLNDANLSIPCAFQNSFYNRLVIVLQDSKALTGDIAAAYRDALMGAPSENYNEDGLPGLRLTSEDNEVLKTMGVRINQSRQIKVLDRELMSDDGPVDLNKIYSFHKVSKIQQYPMDPVLSMLFKNDSYINYNGRGQAAAVRINLKAQGNATTIVNLPTGTGKTLIAHALTLCEKSKLTLVIVPTTALAIDQGNRAKNTLGMTGDGCYFWHGSQDQSKKLDIKSKIRMGRQTILFTSPESACKSLLLPLFDAAKNGLIGSIVIDEAHMVAEWGDDFRPYYQIIGSLVTSLRQKSPEGIKCCLMTATLTAQTMQYLKDTFSVRDKKTSTVEVHGSFLRPEIQYHTLKVDQVNHKETVLKAIRLLPKPLIIYVLHPPTANILKNDLKGMLFFRVGLVTGKESDDNKKNQLELWNSNQLDIMVATSAFGMGVNKDNVRSVLHADMPSNIDSFYQQVGRGGRDGHSAQSIVIWHEKQIKPARQLNNKKLVTLDLGRERWQEMWRQRAGKANSNGEAVVDLTAAHHQLRQNYSRNENVSWNRRVLLSMQRTGMIHTSWPFPQPPMYNGELSSDQNKEADDKYFERYYDTINVTTLVNNPHSHETWKKLYSPQVKREHEHTNRGFESIRDWLQSPCKRSMCELLEATYTIGDLAPEKSCNGCPGCRKLKIKNYLPEVGRYCSVIGFEEQTMWSGPLKNKKATLNLYYSIGEKDTPTASRFVDKHWKWIELLLDKGAVKTIRAEWYVLEMLKKKFLHGSLGFWIGIDINQKVDDNASWPEMVLLMPDAKNIPRFLNELNSSPRLLIAPDHIVSTDNSGRRWWEVQPNTNSLKHFIAGSF